MLQGRLPVTAPELYNHVTEHGRYVIVYNERLDGVTYPAGYELHNVYTELCDVIV